MSSRTASLDEAFIEMATAPLDDPRPIFAALRETAPVFLTPYGFYFISRYDIGVDVLRNDSFWKIQPPVAQVGYGREGSLATEHWLKSIQMLDDFDHVRLRRLVNRLFTPRAAEQRRQMVRAIVDKQLDAIEESDVVDLVHDFALQVPTKVVVEILGLDPSKVDLFVALAHGMISILEPEVTDSEVAHADSVVREGIEYLLEAFEDRRSAPTDDVLTELVAVRDGGDSMSEEELVAMIIILIVGGYETTANTMATVVYDLLLEPMKLAKLRAEPDMIPTATEELLRYDSAPRNSVARYASGDITLGSQLVREGEKVYVGLNACNHDPTVFERPLELDLTRSPNRHISFGGGSHFCLGAALARVELQEGIQGLLSRFEGIELTSNSVQWRSSFVLRGLQALPLRLSA